MSNHFKLYCGRTQFILKENDLQFYSQHQPGVNSKYILLKQVHTRINIKGIIISTSKHQTKVWVGIKKSRVRITNKLSVNLHIGRHVKQCSIVAYKWNRLDLLRLSIISIYFSPRRPLFGRSFSVVFFVSVFLNVAGPSNHLYHYNFRRVPWLNTRPIK